MNTLKILIVEDEILIAEMIKDYLEEVHHEVTDIAISYEEALQSYTLQKPQLILLDIRLYGHKSGIDFAQYLLSTGDKTPIIYLSSQYDQRTLSQALDTHPYGYLTKPIRKESLWTSIESAYKLASLTTVYPRTIELYDGKSHHQVNPENIVYVQADHVYVHVFLQNGEKIVIRMSLKDLEQKIDLPHLWRCHRSFIINVHHIKMRNVDSVFLTNGVSIPLSRSRKK